MTGAMKMEGVFMQSGKPKAHDICALDDRKCAQDREFGILSGLHIGEPRP